MTDVPAAQLPAWDRLAASEGATLRVGPLQRVEVDELLVVDDLCPQLDDATLFWAWADGDGWSGRAARIGAGVAAPISIRARRVRLERPDLSLCRLLDIEPAKPPPSVTIVGEPRTLERPPRHLACICRLTPSEEVYRAMEAGWQTVDELKRATGVAFGECQGRRCVPDLARRLDRSTDEPRGRITPRPPLVPVPASILAAFAAEASRP